jgi:hypothetical protein
MSYGADDNRPFTESHFYRFLTEAQPSVNKAIFRKEMFSDEIPVAARKQIFLLRKIRNDYVLGVLASTNESSTVLSAGSFKGRSWGMVNSILTYSDPGINPDKTPIAAQESITRMTANLFLNLGITELVRSTLQWDSANLQFTGKASSGGEMLIKFEFSNQLPQRAIILNSLGGAVAYIDYEYSKLFSEGRLPHKFSRFFGSPQKNMGQAFSVELLEIDYATDPGMVLDPVNLFHPKTTSYYSNGMVYTVGKSGKPVKVLTAAEYETTMSAIGAAAKPNNARFFVLLAGGLGTVGFLIFLVRTTNNKNK